jgi:hypothetical protein
VQDAALDAPLHGGERLADARSDDEYLRWWRRQGFSPLDHAGTFSIAVPLTPDRWSGVSGQLATENTRSLSWFRIAGAGVPSRFGLVFGDGCSFGHDLYVTGGTATLTVIEFETW